MPSPTVETPTWTWQRADWPRFIYDAQALAPLEARFQRDGGAVIGSVRHLNDDDRGRLTIDILSSEAMETSRIEGEILDRASVQASLRRQFGLETDMRRVGPAEHGIAATLVDVYRNFADPLTDEVLFGWHRLLMPGRSDLRDVGRYRSHPEPMQIVSGPLHAPRVHFEAPPSDRVVAEMASFCQWFNETGDGGPRPLPTLARAGTAHLWFEVIHPFEDGNGRIGRAIAEKVLAQGLGQPGLTALSPTIARHKRAYYSALEQASRENGDVTAWLLWFTATVFEAQSNASGWIDFLIAKTRLLDGLAGRLAPRQEKALVRMLREGPDGFEGGLSARKYMSLTGASAATARRDLAELVSLGALVRTGERKGTRYHLPFPVRGLTPT